MDRTTVLVYRLAACLGQAAARKCRDKGIDLYGSRILVLLRERRSLRVGELVDAMVLPQSTISEQIRRLEQRGYLTRQREASDNRSVTVRLTPLGEETAQIFDSLSLSLLATMHTGIDPAVTAFVDTQLRRMLANLAAAG